MLARYVGEIEDRQQFIDGLVEGAQNDKRDLKPEEMELITRARDRIGFCNDQMKPLEEARRISGESAERIAKIAELMSGQDKPAAEVTYRSAGAYTIDVWRAALGTQEAKRRLDIYHRAAAHQTTGDNPGLLPTPIVEPVINFVDANRPLVTALGPKNLPGESWSRPKVTTHTAVDVQSAEKGELVSQKMTIVKLNGQATTYGGYVNVSRQDIDFTQPSILDIVINDLAGQYAIQTEAAAGAYFEGEAQAGPGLPTGVNTAEEIAGAVWAAVGLVYGAVKGSGTVLAVIPPDMLGQIGPMFAPINPVNAVGGGFSAAGFGSGLVGQVGGVPFYCSPGISASTILILSTAAAEVYENRLGSLQVVEPSVLGLQVAYAGYFTPMAVEPGGIVKIAKTP